MNGPSLFSSSSSHLNPVHQQSVEEKTDCYYSDGKSSSQLTRHSNKSKRRDADEGGGGGLILPFPDDKLMDWTALVDTARKVIRSDQSGKTMTMDGVVVVVGGKKSPPPALQALQTAPLPPGTDCSDIESNCRRRAKIYVPTTSSTTSINAGGSEKNPVYYHSQRDCEGTTSGLPEPVEGADDNMAGKQDGVDHVTNG